MPLTILMPSNTVQELAKIAAIELHMIRNAAMPMLPFLPNQ